MSPVTVVIDIELDRYTREDAIREDLEQAAREGLPCELKVRGTVRIPLDAKIREVVPEPEPEPPQDLSGRMLAWLADHPGSTSGQVAVQFRVHRAAAARILGAAKQDGKVLRVSGSVNGVGWAVIPEFPPEDPPYPLGDPDLVRAVIRWAMSRGAIITREWFSLPPAEDKQEDQS